MAPGDDLDKVLEAARRTETTLTKTLDECVEPETQIMTQLMRLQEAKELEARAGPLAKSLAQG